MILQNTKPSYATTSAYAIQYTNLLLIHWWFLPDYMGLVAMKWFFPIDHKNLKNLLHILPSQLDNSV